MCIADVLVEGSHHLRLSWTLADSMPLILTGFSQPTLESFSLFNDAFFLFYFILYPSNSSRNQIRTSAGYYDIIET